MDYKALVRVVDSSRSFDELTDRLDKYFGKYVPASGKCDTVGGEIVRAMMRLAYRWCDGDEVGVGYGNITCNPSDRYLDDHVRGYVSRWCTSRAYEGWLCDQLELVLSFLGSNERLFDVAKAPNGVDSREYENGHGNRKLDEELEREYDYDEDDYDEDDYEEDEDIDD